MACHRNTGTASATALARTPRAVVLECGPLASIFDITLELVRGSHPNALSSSSCTRLAICVLGAATTGLAHGHWALVPSAASSLLTSARPKDSAPARLFLQERCYLAQPSLPSFPPASRPFNQACSVTPPSVCPKPAAPLPHRPQLFPGSLPLSPLLTGSRQVISTQLPLKVRNS